MTKKSVGKPVDFFAYTVSQVQACICTEKQKGVLRNGENYDRVKGFDEKDACRQAGLCSGKNH